MGTMFPYFRACDEWEQCSRFQGLEKTTSNSSSGWNTSGFTDGQSVHSCAQKLVRAIVGPQVRVCCGVVMSASKIKPMGLAMIICDQVITEASTNKKSLIGTFNQISAANFPCVHPKFFVFVVLTGGHGKVNAELSCMDESQGDVKCFGTSGPLEFKSPTDVVELVFGLNAVHFQHPGNYRMDFSCDGAIVLQRPFTIKHVTGDDK